MSDRPWWTTAIQWGLWAVVMSVVMGWLGRSRLKRRADADASTLVHPTSTLIIGLVCFGLFAGLAIVSNVTAKKAPPWWATGIFVGFAGLAVPMVIDYFVAKHRVSSERGAALQEDGGDKEVSGME